MLNELKKELLSLADSEKAQIYARFFKTGKGEYGEGDVFHGIVVPELRKVAKRYKELSLDYVQKLLTSKMHEQRFIALVILIHQYRAASEEMKKKIYEFYLKNTKYINNWDLVDTSAEHIVGDYLYERSKKILYKLAKSKDLWERRIAILSTFYFIKKKKYDDALKISEILMKDKHDLIHKAVGWMLREIGNRDRAVEEKFLKKYHKQMPRTMLRYAIEKFDEKKRKFYMKK